MAEIKQRMRDLYSYMCKQIKQQESAREREVPFRRNQAISGDDIQRDESRGKESRDIELLFSNNKIS